MNSNIIKRTTVALTILGGLFTTNVYADLIGTASFGTMAQVEDFCGRSTVHCTNVTAHLFGGYSVQYESVQGTQSGPKRGEGDVDPEPVGD